VGQFAPHHIRVVSRGFDLVLTAKAGVALTAESHALKVKFAAADHDRKTRRQLMRELGRRDAKARKENLTKRERKKIGRKASKIAAIKRTAANASRRENPTLSATPGFTPIRRPTIGGPAASWNAGM